MSGACGAEGAHGRQPLLVQVDLQVRWHGGGQNQHHYCSALLVVTSHQKEQRQLVMLAVTVRAEAELGYVEANGGVQATS